MAEAPGRPEFIRGTWICDGAVVIVAGYHPGGIADVELNAVIGRTTAYNRVLGGVGPMTTATLMDQTVQAIEQAPNIALEPSARN